MCASENKTDNKYSQWISDIKDNKESDIPLRDKYIQLKRILDRICKDITKEEALQFSSLFARLVFICRKYKIGSSHEWNLQNIRKKAAFLLKNKDNLVSQTDYDKAEYNISNLLYELYNKNRIGEGSDEEIHPEPEKRKSTIDRIRIEVIDIDIDNQIITGSTENFNELHIKIKYGVKNANHLFDPTIEQLWIGAQLNLIDCSVDENGYYIPAYFVLEPDYLIDASTLAECFQNYGWSHLHYFRRRYEQMANSQHILLGNLANFFLDELIFADKPELLTFDAVFLKAFKDKPFEFTSCNEIKEPSDFKQFMVKAKIQFNNIKRVITEDFPANNIDINNCTLEPSFFCEKFGFQGRLDLLQLSDNQEFHKIVELKSGGLPFPKNDPGKIAINHEVQTTIYRLIIQSVFGYDSKDITPAILYSAAENKGQNLRFAAPYKILEKEIINIRNLIIATEHNIYKGTYLDVENLFSNINNLDNYGKVPEFFVNQIQDFEKAIINLSDPERRYLYRFTSFISRELYIQKIGTDNYESDTSTASLWNTEYMERMENYDLISDLEIENIDDTERGMKILFNRKSTTDFVNFREGDLCILYPHDKEEDTVLSNQILKGSIAEISSQHLLLRFRYKQKNKSYFQKHKLWTVEHDRLDHAYNNMYKSLFNFMKSPIDKRLTLLGKEEPNKGIFTQSTVNEDNIIDKQNSVINKAISAKDYFLIVGPPGTGKTSVFAKQLIEHYHNKTNDNILIIAYTNRAVDELCEAINQAFECNDQECDNYIRIGTELSCGEKYRHRLLQNIASSVKNREELRQIIKNQRIFIGTLASITGKPELFDIKKFNVAIIDEASQILEPQIIGILPKVDKFIMIGDHKQLSTITLQDKGKSKVDDYQLNEIELYNCNESLFERLYRICLKNEWRHTYDTLTYQGRMHQDIANYPNLNFYENALKTISQWQKEPLNLKIENPNNEYQKIIANQRIAFFNNRKIDNYSLINDKVNYEEAEIVCKLCLNIWKLYLHNNQIFDSQKVLGIIAPYRNQVALIKHLLETTEIPELQNIMIDTVERFQGSQRDVIILSFCMNKAYQMDFFSKMNLDGTIDRKLNVALTRARQQLYLVGNDQILRQNKIYNSLLNNIYISIQ